MDGRDLDNQFMSNITTKAHTMNHNWTKFQLKP